MSGVSEAIVLNGSSSVSPCQELTNKIKGALYDIANSFVYIGFLLCEANSLGSFKEWGYFSIYEYASSELGFKKSSVNNFMNICRTFSSNFSSCGEALPYSMILKDDYRNFNYSQLVEMLSMDDKKRSQVTPDMTVKQIRLLKKSDDVDSSDIFQTSGNFVDADSVSVDTFNSPVSFHDVSDVEFVDLFTIFDDEYLSTDDFMNFGEFLLFKFKELGYCLKKIDS